MILLRAMIDTPVGPMRALATADALCAFEFHSPDRMARLDARLVRWFDNAAIEEGENRVIADVRAWLRRYFSGESADTSTLSLEMRGTPFERLVWTALRAIPLGSTTTYGKIAQQLGTPSATRAVGLANGANPIAIIVPCHRVIGANGALTGYGGGLGRKTWLLDHERRYWGAADRSTLPFG